jgi:hypothetical protein
MLSIFENDHLIMIFSIHVPGVHGKTHHAEIYKFTIIVYRKINGFYIFAREPISGHRTGRFVPFYTQSRTAALK